MSRVLVVGRDEWNRTEVASTSVTSTVRACGTPEASAVANVIVGRPDSTTHRASTAIGSARRGPHVPPQAPLCTITTTQGSSPTRRNLCGTNPEYPTLSRGPSRVQRARLVPQLQLDRPLHHVQELVARVRVELGELGREIGELRDVRAAGVVQQQPPAARRRPRSAPWPRAPPTPEQRLLRGAQRRGDPEERAHRRPRPPQLDLGEERLRQPRRRRQLDQREALLPAQRPDARRPAGCRPAVAPDGRRRSRSPCVTRPRRGRHLAETRGL